MDPSHSSWQTRLPVCNSWAQVSQDGMCHLVGAPLVGSSAEGRQALASYSLLSVGLESSSTAGLIPWAGRAARAGPGRAEFESSSTGDGDPIELDSQRRRSGERLARLDSDGFWLSDGIGLDAAGRDKTLGIRVTWV